MSSKEIITILSRLNIPVNNHMSVMETPMVEAVESFFSDVKSRAATRTAAEQERRQERERAMAEARAAKAAQEKEKEGTVEGEGLVRTVRIADVAGLEGRSGQTGVSTVSEVSTEAPVAHATPSKSVAEEIVRAPIEHQVDESATQITGARSTQATAEGQQSTRRPDGMGQRTGQPRSGSQEGGTSGGYNRPQGDRPAGGGYNRPQGDRPAGGGYNRPQGDRPAGGGYNRPQGDRPAGGGYNRPQGDRPAGAGGYNRPQGDRPAGAGGYNRPQGDRPAGAGGYNRPQGDRPAGGGGYNRPQGDRPAGGGGYNRPQGDRPAGGGGYNRPQGDRPAGGGGYNRPQGGSSAGNRAPGRSGGGFGGNAAASGARSDNGARGGAGSRNFGGGSGTGSRFTPAQGDAARSSGNGAGSRKRGSGNGDRAGGNRFGSDRRENNRKLQAPRSRGRSEQTVRAPEGPRQVKVDAPMTVSEFAHLIRREASEVIKRLLFLGVVTTINQEIDTDTMVLVGAEFGTEVIVEEPRNLEAEEMLHEVVDESLLEHRAPVVTIMGHVDHGKTTLLDAIRQTNVTASEAGGITQHIGAYQVEINQKKITFLDTPGHAAFTTMRARGAQVTDITVLVVAADDGVMPQTVEAIDHAKAANVPIIVAINKIDKPGANLERIKQELTEHGLVAEEWGGDTIFVPISALQKQGIPELLEMILLVAEVADLKASLSSRARGSVIEAQLDRGRGPVATVLVQNGTLAVGDIVVAGNTFGRVRAMVNDRGRRVKEAHPSMPVEIVGLTDVPNAGDLFVVYDDERQARQVSERRTTRQRAEELGANSRVTLDDLYKQIQEGEVKDLNLILKADVHGSAEAVLGALQKIEVSGVRIRVIHSGVGSITESDILLASASNAIVLGFNVRPEPNAAKMADSEKVDVRLYRVIYNLVEEIESALKGMLDPVYKEVVLGRAEIRQLFKVSKVGTIAGAMVQEGKLVRDAEARLIRGGVVVHEGKLDSLKRFKDDTREVAAGYECGLTLERFNDIKEGDIVEVFKMEAVKAE
ncbi:MAG: translation initiation factor IF-2 [Firmicutes bacterium]|nr:translation initiation factor IF-2 [Bacillota bacterium]